MDSDTDSNSSQAERGDPFEEFADRFMEFVSNVVREPGQVVEVDLGGGRRLGASIHVDDAGHVVDEMRVNISYRPTEDRQVIEQGGIQLRDVQQFVQFAGWLRDGHRLGVLDGGVWQGRFQLELCRRCGRIHQAGACAGSRGERHERRGGGGGGRRR